MPLPDTTARMPGATNPHSLHQGREAASCVRERPAQLADHVFLLLPAHEQLLSSGGTHRPMLVPPGRLSTVACSWPSTRTSSDCGTIRGQAMFETQPASQLSFGCSLEGHATLWAQEKFDFKINTCIPGPASTCRPS